MELEDKVYCASSYLMYRSVMDKQKVFKKDCNIKRYEIEKNRIPVVTSDDLYTAIEKYVREWTSDGKAALALSGGIDSAIIAKFMPKGSTVYTFQCIVPGIEVANEVPMAKKYAEECGLKQVVVPIYWEDMEQLAPILMRHKGSPIHSIEVQIYKAALQAKKDGFERLIFGESSDVNYGGMSGLMSKDWTLGEFIDRYSYVKPYHALKKFCMPTDAYEQYVDEMGYVDAHEFCRTLFLAEGMGSYTNACRCAGIQMKTPYVHTYLATPLDMQRVRTGENKYIVREVFNSLYKNYEVPAKLPMPRATNEWFKDWQGPTREEFWPHCTDNMTGDQKWLVWALEKFFNLLDEDETK